MNIFKKRPPKPTNKDKCQIGYHILARVLIREENTYAPHGGSHTYTAVKGTIVGFADGCVLIKSQDHSHDTNDSEEWYEFNNGVGSISSYKTIKQ